MKVIVKSDEPDNQDEGSQFTPNTSNPLLFPKAVAGDTVHPEAGVICQSNGGFSRQTLPEISVAVAVLVIWRGKFVHVTSSALIEKLASGDVFTIIGTMVLLLSPQGLVATMLAE